MSTGKTRQYHHLTTKSINSAYAMRKPQGGEKLLLTVILGEPTAGVRRPMKLVCPDDLTCEICGSHMVQRNCKIHCPNCGYTRDCSDP